MVKFHRLLQATMLHISHLIMLDALAGQADLVRITLPFFMRLQPSHGTVRSYTMSKVRKVQQSQTQKSLKTAAEKKLEFGDVCPGPRQMCHP